MSSAIALLSQQAPPPKAVGQPSASEWSEVEQSLGLSLPTDYKEVIEAYGDHYWQEFLYLLNPFSPNPHLNLLKRSEVTLDAERQTRRQFPDYFPLPLYPEVDGMLPIFVTDNGDTGFWLTHTTADKWPLLIKDARSPEFEVRFIRISTFLYQFTSGRFKSVIMPSLSELED